MDIIEREISIDNQIVELADRIKCLDSENPYIIYVLCKLYDRFLYQIKGVNFEYDIYRSPVFNNVYVIYMDKKLKVEQSSDFIETIAEWLVDSVETWLNLDIAEAHLNVINEIFDERIKSLEYCKERI